MYHATFISFLVVWICLPSTGTATKTLTPTQSITPSETPIKKVVLSTSITAFLPGQLFNVTFYGQSLDPLGDSWGIALECSTFTPSSIFNLAAGTPGSVVGQLNDLPDVCGTAELCYRFAGASLFHAVGTVTLPPYRCKALWTPAGGRCLRTFPLYLSWQEAEAFCVAEGGHLASVHNSTGLQDLQGFQLLSNYWVGGYSTTVGVPAGCNWDIWKWSDGTPWDYQLWGWGQPDHVHELCIEIEATTGTMHNAFCSIQRRFVCQTTDPFYAPPAVQLVSGYLGTPLKLKLTAPRLRLQDRYVLLPLGIGAMNNTSAGESESVAQTLQNETCAGCVVVVSNLSHNQSALRLWYLAEGDCVWRLGANLTLPPHVIQGWYAAALDDIVLPDVAACDPFLVLLDGAGLAPTDSVAVLPAGRLPSAATAGTPVGGALSRALRPGAPPDALNTYRIPLNLTEGNYTLFFRFQGGPWTVVAYGPTNGSVAVGPRLPTVTSVAFSPAGPYVQVPVAVTLVGAGFQDGAVVRLVPQGPCPAAPADRASPEVSPLTVSSANATASLPGPAETGPHVLCLLPCGALNYTAVGNTTVLFPPIAYQLRPSSPYQGGQVVNITVNSTALGPADRLAVAPSCASVFDNITFPAQPSAGTMNGSVGSNTSNASKPANSSKATNTSGVGAASNPRVAQYVQQGTQFVWREGNWTLCYWRAAAGIWVELPNAATSVGPALSAIRQADFRSQRLTHEVPLVVFFNGTNLSDWDRYLFVDGDSDCPEVPAGGQPVSPVNATTAAKSAVVVLPQGQYSLCYLRAGSSYWEVIPASCPVEVLPNLTCTVPPQYNETCPNITVLPPVLWGMQEQQEAHGDTPFLVRFFGQGLSVFDRVALTPGVCPTNASAGVAVASAALDGQTAEAYPSGPYVEPDIGAPCPPPYFTYTVCYGIAGSWQSVGEVHVFPQQWCRLNFEDSSRVYWLNTSNSSNSTDFEFCRFMEGLWVREEAIAALPNVTSANATNTNTTNATLPVPSNTTNATGGP
eukprot:EG_transcript_1215